MSDNPPGSDSTITIWDNDDFHCITCSDDAVTVRVLRVYRESALAEVEVAIGGATEEVDISLVEAVAPGDLLLAHGGVALGNLGRGEV